MPSPMDDDALRGQKRQSPRGDDRPSEKRRQTQGAGPATVEEETAESVAQSPFLETNDDPQDPKESEA